MRSATPILERRGDLRDELAKLFECSGRNLDRYARILNTPLEVQQAFDRDELTLAEAGRVAGFNEQRQKEIARRIRAGENAKAVVKELAPVRERRKSRGRKLAQFFKDTRQHIDALEAEPDVTREYLSKDDLPRLKRFIDFATGLQRYIEENPDECLTVDEHIANVCELLDAQAA